MERNKKLFSNSIIFTIGNLGSKFISFFMVPLYTYTLTTSQFGTVDLLITTVNLFLPIASLSLFDAVFRFAMDNDVDNAQVLTSGVLTDIFLGLIVILLWPLLSLFHISYLSYFIVILLATALFTLLQNFARAIGKSVTYAMAGLINAITFAIFNIIFLVVLKIGIEGYLLSYLLAIIISLVYVSCSVKVWRYIKKDAYSYHLTKRMLAYSIPLIPNSLAWWLTNDANRFFILTFVGVAGNGLYAVANKIPTIINMFFNVFTQAWQISAVDEFYSKDNSEYYTSVFTFLQSLLFVLVGVFIVVLKPFMSLFVSPSYFISWKYVPLLLIMAVFSNMSAFLGTTYLAAKQTKGILVTTILGMLVNLCFSFLLTPRIGIYGTAAGGTLGFLSVVLMRLYDLKKIIEIKMNWGSFFGSLLGIFVVSLGLYEKNLYIEFVYFLVGILMLVLFNLKMFKDIFEFVKKYLFSIKRNHREKK